LQVFYSPGFPVGSVIYPATVGKVTPEGRYSFPTGSVKVHPKGRYSFPTGSVKVHPKGRYSFPVGSVIGRRRRTARTFPRNTAVRRYLSHQRRHRTACCGRSRDSPFPTGSVLFPRRVGIQSLLVFTWSVSLCGCMPDFPTGSVFPGRSVAVTTPSSGNEFRAGLGYRSGR
jgi:hypothetical protein